MNVISLKCNNCSADLKIPEKTKFFNCSFCHSSLAVQHFGNTVFTEVLQDIKQDTTQLLDHSESILLEKQISRLDRDWDATAKSLAIYVNRRGAVPPKMSQIFGILFTLILLGVGYFVNTSIFAPFEFLTNWMLPAPFSPVNLISLGFFIVALSVLWQGFKIYRKATKYEEAKTRYEKQRRQLLQQLEKASRN